MIKREIYALLLISSLSGSDINLRVENTNFTLSQGSYIPNESERYIYNYDRFRLYADANQENFFFKATGDLVNYLGSNFINSDSFQLLQSLDSDTPFETKTSFHHYADGATAYAKLYRFYGGYDNGKERIVAGLQNITMGVGHIWTPSNLFNPINTYALEPDETYGVAALTASRYLSSQSQIYGAISQRADHSWKYAMGAKTTIGIVDVTLNAIKSDDTRMLGYTIQSDLGDTGIEIRSEGAWIDALLWSEGAMERKKFFQGILGADYAFQQGLNLTIEALYSSEKFSYQELLANLDGELRANMTVSHFYTGVTMNYDFTIYLSGTLLYIESFSDENSRFAAPSLSYNINNNNTLTLGAQIVGGSSQSEFGAFGNRYYLKYVLSF